MEIFEEATFILLTTIISPNADLRSDARSVARMSSCETLGHPLGAEKVIVRNEII